MKIYFIAPGRVGQALGALWLKKGHSGVGVWGRDKNRIQIAAKFLQLPASSGTPFPIEIKQADLVLITSPERYIEFLAKQVAPLMKAGSILLHTAGSLPPVSGLASHVKSASLHPLQSIADPVQGMRLLPGSYFAISGEDNVIALLKKMVRDIGGIPVRVFSNIHYHLGAVLASNTLYPLFYAALSMLKKAGIDREEATKMLLPLVRGSVENLEQFGPVQGMTGPLARADVNTISRHLHILQETPQLLLLYQEIQTYALRLAKEAGVSPEDLSKIETLLEKVESK